MEKIHLTDINITEPEETWMDSASFIGLKARARATAQEKLDMCRSIYDLLSSDGTRAFNELKFETIYWVEWFGLHTNISYGDEGDEVDYGKLYDAIVASGALENVKALVTPTEDPYALRSLIYWTVKNVYEYNNSAYGVMEGIVQNYENTKFDLESLSEEIKDPDAIPLLKDIIEKLG